MRVLENLAPKRVFYYMEELCQYPHGSYNVDQISDYLVGFAKEHGLRYVQDDCKNVIMYKPATPGYEDSEPIIIQGHMDMVAVKTVGCTKNLETEGLDVRTDGEYVWAEQTSLGGDDGIAVAYALAILESDEYEHPALEVVITTNEEVGMEGAIGLDASLLTGHKMLNIDSEEEGVLTVGCAGGRQVLADLPVQREVISGTKIDITVEGLIGGHSGVMISKQRANANVVMARILRAIEKETPIQLKTLQGGEKGNAIPKSCHATIVTKGDPAAVVKCIRAAQAIQASEYAIQDPDLDVQVLVSECHEKPVLTVADTTRCIDLILAEPDGVIGYSTAVPGLVETSLNLGVLELSEDYLHLHHELRSAVGSRCDELVERVCVIARCMGATTKLGSSYPAWEYNRESKLVGVMKSIFTEQYGYEPKVEIIHAGLECSVFAKKIPGFDAVSFGPNILSIHSTDEKLDVMSVQRTWKYLLEILKNCK